MKSVVSWGILQDKFEILKTCSSLTTSQIDLFPFKAYPYNPLTTCITFSKAM